jgi:GT2 family glycosyltransferase
MAAPGCVDVVIPTFDGCEATSLCLAHLDGEVPIARITVVDDVSSDGTVQEIRRRWPDVRVIELAEHRGLAHALNAGALAGHAEHVLFLNNDIFAVPGAIGRLVDALSADRTAVSAGGRLVDHESGETQDSYRPREFPGPAAMAARVLGLERAWPSNPITGRHVRRRLDDVTPVAAHHQPAGACLLVRRDALEQIGGWDERYWLWYEDVDLSRRLDRLGPALYVPAAVFRHVGRHSTESWHKSEQHRRLYHATLVYALAHFRPSGRILAASAVGVAAAVRLAGQIGRSDEAAADIYRRITVQALDTARGRLPRNPDLQPRRRAAAAPRGPSPDQRSA